MASTNSKNCKLNNGGYLNNRTYQAQRRINKSKKEAAKIPATLLTGLFGFFGLIILAIIGEHSKKKEQEEKENIRVQKEIDKVKAEQERNRKAAERKAKKKAKEQELFELWSKHNFVWLDGKHLYVGLQEFKNMTKQEQKEWCDFAEGKIKYTKKMIKEQGNMITKSLAQNDNCVTKEGIAVVYEPKIIGKPKKKKKGK